MANDKNKSDLISTMMRQNARTGQTADLSRPTPGKKNRLNFSNLDLDSIKPKKKQVEYASVKIRQHLYEEIKQVAGQQGVKQPGKFISLILEAFLQQVQEDEKDEG